jgi:hypothetical protein
MFGSLFPSTIGLLFVCPPSLGELYQYAVDNYPAHNGSALAIADIARLQKRATGCKEFAESLAACSVCGLIEGCHHSDCPNDHDPMDDFNYVGSRHHY